MEKYLGVKLIDAEPAVRTEGNLSNDGYTVIYKDGYRSWSPKDVFDKAYRRIDNLTFGLAIEALKLGNLVARNGWNGKGMHLELVSEYTLPESKLGHLRNGLYPWIGMRTADDGFVPWLASQTDMLAEDWHIVT